MSNTKTRFSVLNSWLKYPERTHLTECRVWYLSLSFLSKFLMQVLESICKKPFLFLYATLWHAIFLSWAHFAIAVQFKELLYLNSHSFIFDAVSLPSFINSKLAFAQWRVVSFPTAKGFYVLYNSVLLQYISTDSLCYLLLFPVSFCSLHIYFQLLLKSRQVSHRTPAFSSGHQQFCTSQLCASLWFVVMVTRHFLTAVSDYFHKEWKVGCCLTESFHIRKPIFD